MRLLVVRPGDCPRRRRLASSLLGDMNALGRHGIAHERGSFHGSAPGLAGWRSRDAALALPQRLAAFLLLAGGAVTGAVILWAGRGETFFADEWSFVVGRRGWTTNTFLEPHGEHISVLPVAIYKLLFAHLACVGLVFMLARRRVGEPAAALAASFLLVLGSAWEMLLYPFELTLLGSVLLGLVALDSLDRGGVRGDLFALVALVGAACSSSAGLPFLAGVAAELVLRRAWRKLWIVGIPSLLYGVWWLEYGRAATARVHLLAQAHAVPVYVLHSIEAAVFGAVPLTSGSIGIVVMLIALLVVLRVARSPRTLTPRLGGLVVAGVTFWVLTGLGRAQVSSGESRYSYFGVVFLQLAAVELSRGARLDRRIGVGLCIVLAASAVSNLRSLDDGGAFLRGHGVTLRAELTALGRLDSPPPATFVPEPAWDPDLRMGDYAAATHDLGSIAEGLPRLRAAPEDAREAADRVLLRAEPPTIRAVHAPACAVRAKSVALSPRARRIVVTAAAPFTLHIRLFASAFIRPGTVVVQAGRHEVRLPAVESGVGWHAEAGGGGRICT